MFIEISGITVEIIKKNIKNLHLSVLPPDGKVRVSAPSAIPDESIELFIRNFPKTKAFLKTQMPALKWQKVILSGRV